MFASTAFPIPLICSNFLRTQKTFASDAKQTAAVVEFALFLDLQHHRPPRGRAITTDFLEKAVTLSLQVKLSDPELVRQWFLSKGSLLLPEGHGSCRCGSRRRR